MSGDIFKVELRSELITTEVITRGSRLGLKLVAARKAKGMTLTAVGRCFGSRHNRIMNWESGVATPSLKSFSKLCRLYGVTPNELLGFK